MPAGQFIDKLCDVYGEEWDIENYNDPAACEIVKRVRRMRSASDGD